MEKALVILSPGFPANESDLNSLPLQQNLVKAIDRNFPHIKIIVLSLQFPFITAYYKWNNIQVISFNGGHNPGIKRLLLWFRVWQKLLRLNKEYELIGLLSFWCIETALIGKYFSNLFRLKHFNWILGQDAKKENQYIKRIRPKGEELVALSDFVAEEFYRNHYIKTGRIILPGIDKALFGNEIFERKIDLLGVGSLIPLKQYDVFIEIIKAIKTGLPLVNSCICGYGQEEEKLRAKISENHLENNVKLMGEMPHDEVLKLMQHAKVFLHTSAYEGFGMVCMEALFAGAQVISFCKPLNKEIKNWHIVKTKQEMIEKAQDLLQAFPLCIDNILIKTIDETAQDIIKLYD